MIDIKSLSVGDWIRHDFYEEDMCIHLICEDGRVGAISKSRFSVSCHIDNFVPIPITREILEKNGFVAKAKIGELDEFIADGIYIATADDCYGWRIGIYEEDGVPGFCASVRSVHEMQHCFTIAGINKEIEL